MDIKVNEQGNILILDGSLVLGNNDAIRKEKVLKAQKGQLRQALELGVGIDDQIHNDEDLRSIGRKIKANLLYDGFNVDVKAINGTIQIKDLED